MRLWTQSETQARKLLYGFSFYLRKQYPRRKILETQYSNRRQLFDKAKMSTVNGHTPYAINPVDFYRTEVSQTLASVTDLKAEDIYSKLQWSKTLDNGDLNLPVAALKVKGAKPVELALQWADKVGRTQRNILQNVLTMRLSFLRRRPFRSQPRPAKSCNSSSSLYRLRKKF